MLGYTKSNGWYQAVFIYKTYVGDSKENGWYQAVINRQSNVMEY